MRRRLQQYEAPPAEAPAWAHRAWSLVDDAGISVKEACRKAGGSPRQFRYWCSSATRERDRARSRNADLTPALKARRPQYQERWLERHGRRCPGCDELTTAARCAKCRRRDRDERLDRVEALVRAGRKTKVIARALEVRPSLVKRDRGDLRRAGRLPAGITWPRWTSKDLEDLRAGCARGDQLPVIAARLGRTAAATRAKAHALGLANGINKRWSAADLAALRAGCAAGETYVAIGRGLDRTPAAVQQQASKQGLTNGRRGGGA